MGEECHWRMRQTTDFLSIIPTIASAPCSCGLFVFFLGLSNSCRRHQTIMYCTNSFWLYLDRLTRSDARRFNILHVDPALFQSSTGKESSTPSGCKSVAVFSSDGAVKLAAAGLPASTLIEAETLANTFIFHQCTDQVCFHLLLLRSSPGLQQPRDGRTRRSLCPY